MGIGTQSPTFPLVVYNASSSKLFLTGGSAQNGLLFDAAAGSNMFYLYNGAAFNSGGFGIFNSTTNT